MIADEVFTAMVSSFIDRHPVLGAAEIAMHVDRELLWDSCTETQVRGWGRGDRLPGEHVRQLVADRIWEDDAEPEVVEKTPGRLEVE